MASERRGDRPGGLAVRVASWNFVSAFFTAESTSKVASAAVFFAQVDSWLRFSRTFFCVSGS